MSEQPGRETIEDDLGSYSIDDEDQLSAEDTLSDEDLGSDVYTPPDEMPRSTEWGTTLDEQRAGETIEQRVSQEVSDPDSAYGAPDNESGLDGPADIGGDDADAIAPQDDWVGGPEVGTGDVAELVSPDEGAGPDLDSELIATETEGLGQGPEAEAMHLVDDADD